MIVGFNSEKLAEVSIDFSPQKIIEYKVKADILRVTLRTPASYSPFSLSVSRNK